MPMYDYCCDSCGFMDEYIIYKGLEEGKEPTECPKCKKGKMKRQFSVGKTVGIDFVGPGFYINDYGKHNWKKNLSIDDQSKVLAPDANGNYKDPY